MSNKTLLDHISSPFNRLSIFDNINGYPELKTRFYKTIRNLNRPVTITELLHQLLAQYGIAFENGDNILELMMRAQHELKRDSMIKTYCNDGTFYMEANI